VSPVDDSMLSNRLVCESVTFRLAIASILLSVILKQFQGCQVACRPRSLLSGRVMLLLALVFGKQLHCFFSVNLANGGGASLARKRCARLVFEARPMSCIGHSLGRWPIPGMGSPKLRRRDANVRYQT